MGLVYIAIPSTQWRPFTCVGNDKVIIQCLTETFVLSIYASYMQCLLICLFRCKLSTIQVTIPILVNTYWIFNRWCVSQLAILTYTNNPGTHLEEKLRPIWSFIPASISHQENCRFEQGTVKPGEGGGRDGYRGYRPTGSLAQLGGQVKYV